ncbi:DUF6586 family protein [uncultured Halopseudomonas sp.]|jgi:hypothetical protein|uniref:DUF6586 family protein n=1 Tax=uncultured Halopseudomonas sp. TaxID=2901193 RepID=UPI0030EF4675|tara:strand:- start:12337 stop:12846 length:510 start_codon:yes stop_codon:yes gene_type:complete
MANEVYTRTNQALHFARMAIDAWYEAENSNALSAITMARYHREHALFHLHRGVLAVAHEVADRYRWPLLEVRSLDVMLEPQTSERFPGPEFAELSELAHAPDSWLGRLLRGWDILNLPPRPEEAKAPADDLIAVSAVKASVDWSLDDAREAHAALTERVACYREGMVEW